MPVRPDWNPTPGEAADAVAEADAAVTAQQHVTDVLIDLTADAAHLLHRRRTWADELRAAVTARGITLPPTEP